MANSVLVVDDEANIVLSLEFIMRQAGFDVRVAHNGEEALHAIQSAPPDLVLLDVMMPERDGYDVCQTIRANPDWKDIRIIMLTAKGRDIERERAWRWGPMITSPSHSPLAKWSNGSSSTSRAPRPDRRAGSYAPP
jgi:DNA-binding response OmpR family regulator